MKFKSILVLAIILFACGNDEKPKISEFDNSVCLEFAEQSGYPMAICDCVKEKTKEINDVNAITYESIEKLVNDCAKKNLGLGY